MQALSMGYMGNAWGDCEDLAIIGYNAEQNPVSKLGLGLGLGLGYHEVS